MTTPQTKFRCIVADPPWPFQWSGGKGGRRRRETELGYKTMTLDEIAALPVADLADEAGCHLFLWATDEMYGEGHAARIRDAWGFKRCAPSVIWRKPNYGMGVFPRPQHEILMVCRRGQASFTVNDVGSVQNWRQDSSLNGGKRHSRKPDAALDLVERVSPGPYLELFARRQRLGWQTWGDQALEHVEMSA